MIVQPSAVPTLPEQVATALQKDTELRVGTVVARTSSGLRVNVAGGIVPATHLMSYQPFVGDEVAVIRQEASWLVLGPMGASLASLTAIPNYSFEDGAVGALPPSWQLVTTAGAPSLTAALWARDDEIDGPQVGRLTAGSSATIACEVVSDPVPTAEGETWSAAAWIAATTALAGSTSAAVELRLGWYSNFTLGSFVSQATSGFYAVTRGMPWQQITVAGTAGHSAPLGSAFLRVKLAFTWAATAGETISFDRILARRIT